MLPPSFPSDLLRLPAAHRPQQEALRLSEPRVAGYAQFRYGTCFGALRAEPTAYELLAVFNEEPGNGDFARLMRHLVVLGQAHHRDVVVVEVHNGPLHAHLVRYWTMEPIGDTYSLLLPVAGPGTCPAAFQGDHQASQLDYLLDVLHNAGPIW